MGRAPPHGAAARVGAAATAFPGTMQPAAPSRQRNGIASLRHHARSTTNLDTLPEHRRPASRSSFVTALVVVLFRYSLPVNVGTVGKAARGTASYPASMATKHVSSAPHRARAVMLVATALLLALLPHGADALAKEDRCSACKAMAGELGRAVAKEMPAMDVDLRQPRGAKPGQRAGKVIDWHLSELRAMELTEDLCRNMEDYVAVDKDGRKEYQKINNNDGPVTISGSISMGAHTEGDKRALRLYCDALIEEHEEEIQALLQRAEPRDDDFDADVRAGICVQAAGVCSAEDIVRLPTMPGAGDTRKPDQGVSLKEATRRAKASKRRTKKGKKKQRKQHDAAAAPHDAQTVREGIDAAAKAVGDAKTAKAASAEAQAASGEL